VIFDLIMKDGRRFHCELGQISDFLDYPNEYGADDVSSVERCQDVGRKILQSTVLGVCSKKRTNA
jgi:hypothetical protein